MNTYSQNTTIKSWAEEDRPREKLVQKGRQSLSDAELLAIILATGTREESAVDLARRILADTNNNLIELAKLSYNDLVKRFKGVGPAKAISLIAALELGNRKRAATVVRREKISCSLDAYNLLSAVIRDNIYEEFWIILLNRANKIINWKCISEGGISGTVADPRRIFKTAIESNAAAIILAHNHPSGNVQPSEADIKLTRKLRDAGILLDLPVIDHIIIGDENYYSFADQGEL
jgi:DNA repair protein RadC